MFAIRQIVLNTLFATTLAPFLAAPAVAEIYKYRDEQGRWHFSDSPPVQHHIDAEVVGKRATAPQQQSGPDTDLAQALEAAFAADSPIERATLAVLSVKTSLGGGTGFFVSEDGYIVTNRHVVRPTTTVEWQKASDQFKQNVARLAEQKRNLDRRRGELRKMATELESYKRRINSEEEDIKDLAQADYTIYKNRYADFKESYARQKRAYEENRRMVDKQRSRFGYTSTLSRTAQRFKIVLKDNTQLYAQLIAVSQKHDLALLKLNGHTTPFIDIHNTIRPSQGSRAYAIGSPLGLRDFVTSGTITNVQQEQIFTDTQILPGNSGGPLIDPQGRIIGVNTLKVMADRSRGSAGFGIAIPITLVKTEFGKLLPTPQ